MVAVVGSGAVCKFGGSRHDDRAAHTARHEAFDTRNRFSGCRSRIDLESHRLERRHAQHRLGIVRSVDHGRANLLTHELNLGDGHIQRDRRAIGERRAPGPEGIGHAR